MQIQVQKDIADGILAGTPPSLAWAVTLDVIALSADSGAVVTGYVAYTAKSLRYLYASAGLSIIGGALTVYSARQTIDSVRGTVLTARIKKAYNEVLVVGAVNMYVYGDKYFGGFKQGFLNVGTMKQDVVANDPTSGFWIVPLENPSVVYIYYQPTLGAKWARTEKTLNAPAPSTAIRFTADEILRIESSL